MSDDEEDDPGAKLLARHRAGDPDAFGLLHERFGPAVRSDARKILSVEGGLHLDDVTQETWIAVDRHADTFDATKSLKTWLKGIARRECLHVLPRGRIRRAHRSAPEDARSMNDESEQRAAALDLDEALEAMPASERELLELQMKKDP